MLRLKFNSRIFTCLAFTFIRLSLCNISETQAQSEPVFSHRPPGYLNQYQSNRTHDKTSLGPPQPLKPDTVVFYTNVFHPHQNGVFVECDLVRFGEVTLLPNHENITFELIELNPSQSGSVGNPWMSCRFLILLRNELQNGYLVDTVDYTPPRKPYNPYDPYYNVSLLGTKGGRSVTRVILNDTGIFIDQQFLSLWGVANESQISLEPGLKYLNSQSGKNCEGACVVIKKDNESVCMVQDDYYLPHFSNCTPRSDYDIKKYAYDEIVTATGIPCISKCEVTAGGYLCKVRTNTMGTELYNQVCSPSPGPTNMGEKCTGPCTFHNNNYMTCPTVNKTSRHMPCSKMHDIEDLKC